ncbi:MAG: hypothetical protein ACRCR2_02335 [Fusobacteriaceae bacterium]
MLCLVNPAEFTLKGIIKSPLFIQVNPKTKFILNLNNYRNAHYHTLNKAKILYKEHMKEQILKLPKLNAVRLVYIMYPGSKRSTDTGNVCSIHQKFFEDALTELGILTDDNYKIVQKSEFEFGSVCKELPRVDIYVYGKAI